MLHPFRGLGLQEPLAPYRGLKRDIELVRRLLIRYVPGTVSDMQEDSVGTVGRKGGYFLARESQEIYFQVTLAPAGGKLPVRHIRPL